MAISNVVMQHFTLDSFNTVRFNCTNVRIFKKQTNNKIHTKKKDRKTTITMEIKKNSEDWNFLRPTSYRVFPGNIIYLNTCLPHRDVIVVHCTVLYEASHA